MKNVLVTGGTGFLGNNVVRELLNAGFKVRVAIRSASSRKPFVGLAVDIIEVDFQDPDSIRNAVRKIDTVIHVAGLIWFGWEKLGECRKVNVDVTRLLAEECLARQVRLVHVSSIDALPVGDRGQVLDEESTGNSKPQCNYVVSKCEADQVLKKLRGQGLELVIVHPGLMFGPWDWRPSSGELIQALSRMGSWFVCPTGGTSVCDVRDVARGILRAASAEKAGRDYILAGQNLSYRELCHRIAKKLNVGRCWLRTGPLVYLLVSVAGKLSGWFGKEHVVNTGTLQMGRLWHHYSSERARTELAYQVRDIDETLEDAVDWLAEQNMIRQPQP
ncbi:MAG: NAD-dependent epimerase/dehydratase family protein [Planctomycetota bacterium]|nr:NAD-dependent epimerase/dehydratase family protein [Planctomycetota bacterium]